MDDDDGMGKESLASRGTPASKVGGVDHGNSGTEDYGDLGSEWVGIATLIGPVPKTSFQLSGAPQGGTDEEETRWQMTRLFTSPAHRGQGLANKIIQSATTYGRHYSLSLSRTPSSKNTFQQFRLRIMIHPNTVVVSLYSKQGFVDAGRATERRSLRMGTSC